MTKAELLAALTELDKRIDPGIFQPHRDNICIQGSCGTCAVCGWKKRLRDLIARIEEEPIDEIIKRLEADEVRAVRLHQLFSGTWEDRDEADKTLNALVDDLRALLADLKATLEEGTEAK
jgi:hypothetical protein